MHFASELTPLTAFMINTIYATTFFSLGTGLTDNNACPSCEPYGLTCDVDLLHTGLGSSTTPNNLYPDWLDAQDASKAKCLKCLSNICQGTKFNLIYLTDLLK